MKKQIKTPTVQMVKIVKTTRDGSLDTYMPLTEALSHYEAGRMVELLGQGGHERAFQWKEDSDKDEKGLFER